MFSEQLAGEVVTFTGKAGEASIQQKRMDREKKRMNSKQGRLQHREHKRLYKKQHT